MDSKFNKILEKCIRDIPRITSRIDYLMSNWRSITRTANEILVEIHRVIDYGNIPSIILLLLLSSHSPLCGIEELSSATLVSGHFVCCKLAKRWAVIDHRHDIK